MYIVRPLITQRPQVEVRAAATVTAYQLVLSSAEIEPRHLTLSKARSLLYQRKFSRPKTDFSAFFEIYKKIIFSRANFAKFCEKLQNLTFLKEILQNFAIFFRNPQKK